MGKAAWGPSGAPGRRARRPGRAEGTPRASPGRVAARSAEVERTTNRGRIMENQTERLAALPRRQLNTSPARSIPSTRCSSRAARAHRRRLRDVRAVCRSDGTHPLGQILIVTAGCGLHQRWGEPIEEIRPGDVVTIGADEKHWHGAAPSTAMTHIAIQESLDGKNIEDGWRRSPTTASSSAADEVAEGYRGMDERRAIKALLRV